MKTKANGVVRKRSHVPDGMSVSPQKSCAAIARGNEHAPRTQHEKQKALTIDRKCETWSSGGGLLSGLDPRRAGLRSGSHSSPGGDARHVFPDYFGVYLGTWLQPLPSELQQTAPRGCLLLFTHTHTHPSHTAHLKRQCPFSPL